MKSEHEERLVLHCKAAHLPRPVREYQFYPKRRWRLDLAWPEFRLGAEVQGGQWTAGRHNRPTGYESDCEKANAAILAGWRILRFTPAMIESGQAIETLEKLLK